MAGDDLVIDLSAVDDDVVAPAAGQEGAAPAGGKKPAAGAQDDPLEDLRGQLAAANDRAAQASQTAARERQNRLASEQEVATLRGARSDSQMETLDSGIEAAKARGDAAELALVGAYESGDMKAVARHQREISSAEADMAQLKAAKADLEAQNKRAPKPAEVRQSSNAGNDDPVERIIAQSSPPTANWLRAHRDYLTDPKKNAKMNAAHYEAVGDGLVPDSPEYFQFVEKKLGLSAEPAAAARPQNGGRRPGAPALPPDNGADAGGPRSVRLTAAEAASATDGTLVWNYDDPTGKNRFKKGDPIGTTEFARRKLQMQQQGLYDKSLNE